MSQMQIGERTFTIGCIRDISGRKAYTEALEHRTLHDELTGPPEPRAVRRPHGPGARLRRRAPTSRAACCSSTSTSSATSTRRSGASSGDAVLEAVAERLRGRGARLRHRGAAGRRRVRHPAVRRDRRRDGRGDRVEGPRRVRASRSSIAGEVVDVRASIGIAFFPQHGRTTADLLRRADLAMRQAKRSGGGLAVFVAEPEDQTARRLTLLSELRDGIPRGELVLHYQPKVDLATRKTTGVEALVRWQPPDRRAADARAVHARGRAQRADRAADALGARRGAAPAARVERRRAST